MSKSVRVILFVFLGISCLSGYVNGPVALLLGFLFTNFVGNPFSEYNQKAVNWMLKIGVVGLGFGISVNEALEAGSTGLTFTLISIVGILVVGIFLGRLLRLDPKMAHLLSVGTAICGGSAIAATAPVIQAKESSISMALGVVFLLNAVALFLFPVIGHALELSQHTFGMWSAIAIHDTSSVVGAADTYGVEALKVATTVKLARTLWIIPVSLLSMLLYRSTKGKLRLPWFIGLFALAVLLNSYGSFPLEWSSIIVKGSRLLLVLTLFLVGAGLSFEKMKAAGWKPMLLGVLLWVLISCFSLVLLIE
jgi:uncharacterized integral membrane protein (TIGR00698 family)